MSGGGMAYRPDIDGLRAVAVGAVLLYHANIPYVTGGFVGVDIFFVISGYLITSIIIREIAAGAFSLTRFYERRARRILPALFATIAFCSVVGALILLPSEFENLSWQILGAALFTANIVFWQQTSYFSSAADSNLLLHTWSLGVEEQFYILVPLLLMALYRFAPRWTKPALVLLTLGSLLLCIALTPSRPSTAFYMLHTRAWELGFGSILALGIVPAVRNRALAEALGAAGMAMILIAVFTFDGKMNFPGSAAILPVLGAALVLHTGQHSLAGRALSNRVCLFLGLISYSLYLWHWPIFVAADLSNAPTGLLPSIILIVVATAVAWVSWRFIETPFRSPKRVPLRPLWVGSGAGFASYVAVAVGFASLDGWPERFSTDELRYVRALQDISPLRDECHLSRGLRPIESFCRMGADAPDSERLIVWGDSHAVEISYAMSEVVPVTSITYSACAPLIGFVNPRQPMCASHNAAVLDALSSRQTPATVLLALHTSSYFRNDPLFENRLKQTLSALTAAGHQPVVLGPTPGTGENLPKSFARGGPTEVSDADNLLRPPGLEAMLERVTRETGAILIKPSDLLCGDTTCSLLVDGNPVLFDHHHPSLAMARKLAPVVVAAIEQK